MSLGLGRSGRDQKLRLLVVATYSLAAHATPRNALAGAGFVAAAAVAFESLTFVDKTVVDVLAPAVFLAGAWIVGREVHRQRQDAGEAAAHSELLARTHQLERHSAVAAERIRIARELQIRYSTSHRILHAGYVSNLKNLVSIGT